jgi:glycosyltransferase involved in cell wall biosynthesis
MDVSVVIPTYNRAASLPTAVESALRQTHVPLEVLVVDDGSTDDTAEVCRAFPPPVRYIRQDNGGCAAARNTGIAHARGEFIALLDSDDVWEPTKLEVQLDVHRAHPEIGCSATNSTLIDLAGNSLPERDSFREIFGVFDNLRVDPEEHFASRLSPTEVEAAGARHACYVGDFFELLFLGNVVLPSSALIHRRVLERVGSFDASLRFAEETEFFHRAAEAFPLAMIMTPLVGRRVGDEEAMTGPGNDVKFIAGALKSLDRVAVRRGVLSDAETAAYRRGREMQVLQLAYYHLSLLETRNARSVLSGAWGSGITLSSRSAAIYAASFLPVGFLRRLHSLKRALRR